MTTTGVWYYTKYISNQLVVNMLSISQLKRIFVIFLNICTRYICIATINIIVNSIYRMFVTGNRYIPGILYEYRVLEHPSLGWC